MTIAGTAPAAVSGGQPTGHPTNTRAVMAGVLLALLLASLDQTVEDCHGADHADRIAGGPARRTQCPRTACLMGIPWFPRRADT